MKHFLTILSLLCIGTCAYADDLSATHIAADFGKSNGSIHLLITGGIGPYTISWTGPGGFSDTAVNIDSLAPGTYCATVTDAFCGKAELCVTVEENPVTIREWPADAFSISPNPFYTGIQIRPDRAIQQPLQLLLCDINGRVVMQQQLGSMPLSGYYWSAANTLAPAIYMLQVRTEDGRQWQQRLLYQSGR